MWSDAWFRTIVEIHQKARPTVMAVTGGGASAIGELLAVPGASRTILDAQVPYASQALIDWLGRKPDHYCDERTALAMASVAAAHARRLIATTDSSQVSDLLGVACTASLASDRPKLGDHRCFVAMQSCDRTTSYQLTLEKGARTRPAEEEVVGQLITHALAVACGVDDRPQLNLLPSETLHEQTQLAVPELGAVWNGSASCVWSLPDGSFADRLPQKPKGLLCGAFDPVHHGHEDLRKLAQQRIGGPVAFELSITNVDKPPLDFLSIERRRRQFQHTPLALTNAPRFWQKALIFPHTTFVIGSDTARRILEVKYYDHDAAALQAALETIRNAGCRFLVAARLVDGKVLSLSQLHVPESVRDLFEEILESEFREDISSTELRKKMSH